MKIGIDIRNIGKNRTGDEAVFLNLVKNLAKIDKVNSYKLFTDITDKETLEKIKKDLGIENSDNFEMVPLSTKNRFSWNFWTLQKYLRENPVDAYLTQYVTPWFVPKKIKIYTVIHDISFNFYPRLIKFSDLLFLKLLIPLSLRRADKIIAVSNFTRGQVVDYYRIDPKKVLTIHNAAADKSVDLSEERIVDAKAKYKLPEKYILYLGTLQPRKNLPVLIEAYAQLPAGRRQGP
jgi:glycosyltransferase involved in cell wall biosynthesis